MGDITRLCMARKLQRGVRTIFGPNVERCQEEEMNKYSTEEKQQAIDLYFKNGCNMKKTVREGGADAFLDLN